MTIKTIPRLQSGFFRPPHVRGDRDFWGHGPRTQGSVTLSIYDSRYIIAGLRMKADEVGGDTCAEGTVTRRLFTAPAGVRLLRITSAAASTFSYVDRDQQEDIVVPGRGEVAVQNWSVPASSGTDCVSFLRVVGDTNGDESGSRTGFEAFLKPVQVEIEGDPAWRDFPITIDQVAPGHGAPTPNGCSGASGAALLNAYGVRVTARELHERIRSRGNLIASFSGAAPPGAFRDTLREHKRHIVLREKDPAAFLNVCTLVSKRVPVIILMGWTSKYVRDTYAPEWDALGANIGAGGDMMHYVVLKGIDGRNQAFCVMDNGTEKRWHFDLVRNTLHFRKEWHVEAGTEIAGVHSGSYLYYDEPLPAC